MVLEVRFGVLSPVHLQRLQALSPADVSRLLRAVVRGQATLKDLGLED